MTTIDGLADELDLSREAIGSLVGQLVDIEGGERVLVGHDAVTESAAETIREQVRAGSEARDSWLMVRAVEDYAGRVHQREQDLRDAVEARDEAIREAHRRGARVTDLAQAAGLHRTHVHRIIRDG